MTTQNIVFIDSRVAGYETLVAQLGAGTEWHLLQAGQDGIEQMQRLLAGRTGLDSIQLVSHGAAGALYLGSTVLNSGNLGSHQSQLQAIGASLSQSGDILLYGCNVAQGQAGASFVDALARMTGADVAASDDATGPAQLGGDAELERASGSIEAAAIALGGLHQTLGAKTDPTFSSSGGQLTTDLGSDDQAHSLIQQADGKLVVAGASFTELAGDFALARYRADGTLDTSFSGDGKLTTDLGARDVVQSVIQQADGKLVVAGFTFNSSGVMDFALARYNADGTLDTRFSGDGKLTLDFGGDDEGGSVIQQADGKLVMVGATYNSDHGNSDFALMRYNADGTLDTSFSGDGKLTTDFGSYNHAQDIIQQADGKLVVVGGTYRNGEAVGEMSGDFALARYNANGTLDTRFGEEGKVTTDFGTMDTAYAVVQQADGKLVVAGTVYEGNDSNFALARYNADGTLDTSFGDAGQLTTDFGGYDSAESLIVQADGKLLVAGNSYNNGRSDFALARYNADGTLDTSFDGDGQLTTSFGWSSARAYSVIQQADGKLVASGTLQDSISGSGDFALARYNLDGSLDITSNNAPSGTLTITGAATQGRTLTLASTLADADGMGTISYQWQANGYNIAGATGNSLVLGQAQVGKTISVTASYIDGLGMAESVTSATTAAVANVNDAPTGNVTISGTAALGRALQVVSTLQDPDGNGTAHFQWLRDNTAITGATASSYTLTAADVGQSITARLSYTDGGGFAESRTSAAVVVPGLNPGVTISGADRMTDENGDTALFSVKLDKAPVDPVTIRFAVSDATEARLGTSSLTFTSANWHVAQTLTVTGVDDDNNDGAIAYNLTASIATNDLSYKRVIISPIALSNQDDGLDAPILRYGTDAEIDYMQGNNGADRLYGRGNMDDLRGGRGDDRLYGDEDDDVLYGQDGNDWLYGGADDDQLFGGSGNDELYGNDGVDRLEGGTGNDTLDGGTGADTMIGGAGNDTYLVDNANDVVNDQGAATDEDTVLVLATIRYKLAANVENAEIGDSSGAASLEGNTLANELTGNASKNTLDGGAGNDVLDAGAGTDTLLGGAGADTLIGGLGGDTLNGGEGDDLVDYTDAAAGFVNVNLAKGSASGDGADTLISIEDVIGSAGADTLAGSSADNELSGDAGNDMLAGGAGSDRLDGGAGADKLYGGTADRVGDVFDFNAITESTRAARDKVYDFVTGIDKIDLADIDANLATNKADDQAFVFNATAAKANAVWYKVADVDGNAATSDLILYGDVNGDTKADFEIGLVGVTSLASGDFVL